MLDKNLWEMISQNKNIECDSDYLRVLLKNNIITGATMAFKRDLFEKSYPFNEFWLHDYWIGLVASLFDDKIKALDLPLILYRQHDSNVIGATERNLIRNIKDFFSNFSKIHLFRKNKLRSFKKLNEFIKLNNNLIAKKHINEFNQVYTYWEQMDSISTSGNIKALKIILSNVINGNYSKYYTGFRGALRDIVIIFLK